MEALGVKKLGNVVSTAVSSPALAHSSKTPLLKLYVMTPNGVAEDGLRRQKSGNNKRFMRPVRWLSKFDPWNPQWKKMNNSSKLSSDMHSHALAHTYPFNTHSPNKNKHNLKIGK